MARTYNVYNGSTKIASGITGKSYEVKGLTADKEYTFSVTAVDGNLESAKSSYKVKTAAKLVTSVTPSQQTMAIKVGDADRAFSFTVAPTDAGNTALNIVSSDTAVFTLVGGKVHPVAQGTADVVATAKDGSNKSGKIAVTVSPAAE